MLWVHKPSQIPLISQLSKPSIHNPLNIAGNVSIATSKFLVKNDNLDTITSAPLCLHSSITLENSVFSSNLPTPPTLLPNELIIDSGTTDHMVHSITLLTKITSAAHISVKIPNGESVLVTHNSQVQLSSNLVLDNVFCVPSFSFNLISIGKLTHHLRCCCIFLSHFYFIQDLLQWKTIGLGRKLGGLYIQH